MPAPDVGLTELKPPGNCFERKVMVKPQCNDLLLQLIKIANGRFNSCVGLFSLGIFQDTPWKIKDGISELLRRRMVGGGSHGALIRKAS
jgi:hypothetical protein